MNLPLSKFSGSVVDAILKINNNTRINEKHETKKESGLKHHSKGTNPYFFIA